MLIDIDGFSITEREWKVISVIPTSKTLREVARKSNMSLSTVQYIFKRLYKKGKAYFVPDYYQIGIIPIAFITDSIIFDEIPYGTMSIRNVYGNGCLKFIIAIVPYKFIDRYCEDFGLQKGDKEVLVRGLKYIRWRPDSGGTLYLPRKRILIPTFSKLFDQVKHESEKIESYIEENKVPDLLDMIILTGKLHFGPFSRPLEILKKAKEEDPKIPIVSSQVLAYHYKKHVIKTWLYNTYIPFLPMNLVPFRIFFIKGREAGLLARFLIKLPYFNFALIDVNSSIIVGQPPCFMHEKIFETFSMFDVELPLGELIMSSRSIVRFVPHLWKFVRWDGGRWVWWWPEERLRVRVRK